MKDGVKVDEYKLIVFYVVFVNGGVFFYVLKNVQVEMLVQVVYVYESNDMVFFNYVLIVVEDYSFVIYVENYISIVNLKDVVFNIISEVIIGDNVSVIYGVVDNLFSGVIIYVNCCGVVCGCDSKIEWVFGLMNDGDMIFENIINFYGDGIYGDMKMVVVGRGE